MVKKVFHGSRWVRGGGLTALALLVSFAFLPPAVLLVGGKPADYFYREISYSVILDQMDLSASSDAEKAQRIFDFVFRHYFSAPFGQAHSQRKRSGEIISQRHPVETMVNGFGECSISSMALATLVSRSGVPAQVVQLFGRTPLSTHTVAAVLLNGQWRIFDPVFGLVFREEKTGEIAIFDDIQKRGGSLKSDRFDRIGRLARSQAIPASADLKNFHDTYFTHFEPAHPAQWSGSYAQRGFLRRTVETFLNLYFAAVGRRGAFLLQDIYLQRHWPYNTIKSMYNRGRHYHLFGRSGKAETAYREVIAAVHTVAAVPLNGQWGIFDPAHDLVFRDEKTGEIAMVAGNGRPWFDRASFHYGRLLLDLGRARDAQIQFEKTSHNNSIWKDPAAYYLSRIALKQGNQSRALALIEPTLKYLDTDAPLLFMNLTLASKTSSLQTP